MKRQHGMGLAAAEIGLQADHRIAALAGQAPDGRGEYAPQALGRIGNAEERRRIDILLAAFAQVDQREIGRELGIGEACLEHVRVRFADLAPRAQPFRGRRLVEGERPGLRRAPGAVGRALLLVEPLDGPGLRRGAHRRRELTHGVQVAQGLPCRHLAREMRGAVARVHGVGDEAPRLPQIRVVPEQVLPVVEQGLEQCVEVEVSGGFVAARPARMVPPMLAVAVAHVLCDIGTECFPERLQGVLDSLLGRKRRVRRARLAHDAVSVSINLMRSPKRRKSPALNVSSRRSP